MQILTEIIKLLLTMVPDQRHSQLREEPPLYRTVVAAASPAEVETAWLSNSTAIPW